MDGRLGLVVGGGFLFGSRLFFGLYLQRLAAQSSLSTQD
jgi:hypothetical protein